MIGIGVIVANWVGYGCQFLGSSAQWRLPLGLQVRQLDVPSYHVDSQSDYFVLIQMVPAFLLLIGIQFLPQSPRWLLEVGRDDEARAVIYKLNGTATPEELEASEEEFRTMSDNIKAELLVKSSRLSDLWADKAMMRRSLTAIGVQMFGQFTGINVINYYGPKMCVPPLFKIISMVMLRGSHL